MKTYFEESLAISMTLRQSAVALWVELQWISAAAGRGGRLVVTEGVPMSLDTIHAMIGGPGKHMKKSMLRKDFRELESRGLVVTRHGISELPAVVEWADGLQKTSQSGVGRESDVSRTRVGRESDQSRTRVGRESDQSRTRVGRESDHSRARIMHARTEIRQDKTRQDEREDETRQDDTLARTDDAGADEARPIETRARADGARAEGEAPGRKRAPEASAPGIARLMEALAASGESRGLDLCARFLRLWPEDLGEAGEASVRSVFMALPPQDMSRAVAGLRAWLREDLLSQSRTRPSAADWIAQRQWDLAGSEAPEDSLRSASASDFEGLVN